MKDEIRIKLSVGLIAVAVIHAVLLGGVFTALHHRPAPQKQTDWSLPSSPPATPEVGRIEKLEVPPTVNLPAQAEMKQQIFRRRCKPCQPTVVQPSYSVPTVTVQPATPSVPIVVTPTKPIASPKSEKKRYQLALFIGSDAKETPSTNSTSSRSNSALSPNSLSKVGSSRPLTSTISSATF